MTVQVLTFSCIFYAHRPEAILDTHWQALKLALYMATTEINDDQLISKRLL